MSSGIESDSWVGRKLGAGRYEICKLLGEGGMGFVFLARDNRLETDVVIKFPHRAMLADPNFARRFARETRSLIKLEHPHIVRINDVGEEDGMPFLVMPFLGGGSLNGRRPRDEQGRFKPVKPSNLRGWVLDAAKALDFIHDRGYVHRDIKPDNILFDVHQNVYISDFGIAKAVGESAEKQTNLTGAGVIGTPGYIAPEILLGHSYDGRSDQYSLAVAVYEVLAGRRPFEGATPAVVIGLQTMKPAPDLHEVRGGLPKALADVVMQALQREPAKRFPSCVDFARALEETLDGHAAGGVRIPAHSPDEKTVTYHEADAAAADSDTGTAQNRRTLVQPASTPQPPPLTAHTQRTSSSPSVASSATIRTVPSSGGPPSVPPPRPPTGVPPVQTSFRPSRRKTSASLVIFWSFFVLLLAGSIGGAVWWIRSQKKPAGDIDASAKLTLSERKDHLKQIGVAFHGYHDAHRHFPAADAPGYGPGSGRINHRGLSWRVHLLPYLNQQALYDQFRLDEPWDSAHNKKLIDKMPAVFQSPGVTEPGKTSLHVFVGPKTPFATSQGKSKIFFLNGLSNTLLVVEAGPEKADIWTKPGGIPYEPDGSPRSMLGKVVDGEFLVLMADGGVRQYPLSLDQNTFRQLVEYRTDPQSTRRGGPPASGR